MAESSPTESSPAGSPDAALLDRIAELEAAVARLTEHIDGAPPRHPAALSPATRPLATDPRGGPLGRRALLGRLGGVAAVGAGAALGAASLGATPAAAANFDPVLAGTDVTSTNPTSFDTTSAFASMIVKHQLNTSATALYVGRGGTTNNGQAIYCNSDSNHEDASSLDVRMSSNQAKGSAVYAYNNGSGVAIEAKSVGPTAISASGARAGLRLDPLTATGPSTGGAKGELRMDSKVSLYVCTAEAIPTIVNATWRRVTTAAPGYDNGQHPGSVGSSGSLNLMASPFRVYDSRPGQSASVVGTGKLQPSTNLDIAVTNVAPVGGGPRVPVGAIGVMVGLTVTSTGGPGGYLKAFPTGVAVPNTSVINWFGANQNLAVTTIVRLDASGRFTLRAGTAPTDVVVDVVGFLF